MRWMTSRENRFEFLLYLVFGLIWVVAQVASVLAMRRRRRQQSADVPGADEAAQGRKPERSPPPVVDDLQSFLTALSGQAAETASREDARPPARPAARAPMVKVAPWPGRSAATPAVRRNTASDAVVKGPAPVGVDAAPPGFRPAFQAASYAGRLSLPSVRLPLVPMPPIGLAASSVSASAEMDGLHGQARERIALRRAFVLKTLLDPPRGLE